MREKSYRTANRPAGVGAPHLRLVPGGLRTASPAGGDHSLPHDGPTDIRDALVSRARTRVASGYYQRPEVVERLVELLWDELSLR